MQGNSSPEEKLLDLIKKGTNSTKEAVPEPPKQDPVRSSPAKAGRPTSNGASVSKKLGARYPKPFPIFNKFLVLLLVCAIVYTVFTYIHYYKTKTEIPGEVEIEKGGELLEDTPTPPALSHYTDVLGRRQMFKLYEAPKPKPVGPPKPKITLQQLLAGYTFIGVIFGDVPQAIVEEKRTGQSFYLTAGQYLGEIKIEKIDRGRITVSYEDEMLDISI